MDIKQKAGDYFLNKNRNCAESVWLAACETYGIESCPVADKAVGCFGGGAGVGNICGALAAALAFCGVKKIETVAHEASDLKPTEKDIVSDFTAEFGSTNCSYVRPLMFNGTTKCLAVVQKACEIIEKRLG